MERTLFAEVRSDYICEDFTELDGDIKKTISIDAWKTADDNEEGTVVATVILSKSGDILVCWHDNAARMDPKVIEAIKTAKMVLMACSIE